MGERTFSEISIPVPWGYIKGKWWGPKEKRPILCAHGWQDNAGTFDSLVKLLPSSMSFLCIDLPGHGLSSHIPKGMPYYLWWDNVINVRRIVKHYGWDKVSIMGHSLGGATGFLYAAAFPTETDLLISLDVVAPIMHCKPEEVADSIGPLVDGFLQFSEIEQTKDPVEKYDDMIDTVYAGHKNALTRESCEVLMKRGIYMTENGTYKFTRDNRVKVGWVGGPTADLITELAKRIRCRYMNIRCIPGHISLNSQAMYTYLLDIIEENAAEFEFHEVSGGHHVHLNEPSKVSSLIARFLSKTH